MATRTNIDRLLELSICIADHIVEFAHVLHLTARRLEAEAQLRLAFCAPPPQALRELLLR